MDRRLARRFAAVLALITVGAFALRVVYTVTATARPDKYLYDWAYYRGEAKALVDGDGFVQPAFATRAVDRSQPAADHPPLYVVVLAPVSWLSGDNDLALRLLNCVLGAIGVALIGLLGKDLAGERTGLVAAVIAAIYPNLWVNDGVIMAESLSVVIITLALILTLRVIRKPTAGAVAALAFVCGLGALTRSEFALLFPVLCLPALFVGARHAGVQPARLLAVSVVVVGVTVGPWVAYNLSRFEKPVFISTNFDQNLLASSCPESFHGKLIGELGFCTFLQPTRGRDASVVAAKEQHQAFTYIRQNLGAYPVAVLARIGRTWSLYRPLDGLDVGLAEGRPRWVTELGLGFYYPLLALAALGAWRRRRARAVLWPLLVPIAIVTVSMLVSYGQVRYRVSCEPVLVVLAAAAIVGFFDDRRSKRARERR